MVNVHLDSPIHHDPEGPEDTERAEILLPQDILTQFPIVNIAAPMVRYSKLPFRELVSKYETHITTTPMMLAKEFSRSSLARDSEFSTNSTERGTFLMEEPLPSTSAIEFDDSSEHRSKKREGRKRRIRGCLMVQFAANDGVQLGDAAELIKPWVDGVDINCGCPQKWAYQEGIGCALLRKPELVRDLIRSVKSRLGWDFPVSVKVRVDPDLSLTQQLIKTSLYAGASIITIHGRTRHQSSSGHPVNLDAIKFAVECGNGQVPMIANGDVFSLDDAENVRKVCGVRGVMSARGLLANPALFAGYDKTPPSAISQFLNLSTNSGLIFPLFHRHLAYMLESHFPKKRDRIYFNSLVSHTGVYDYCEEWLEGGVEGLRI